MSLLGLLRSIRLVRGICEGVGMREGIDGGLWFQCGWYLELFIYFLGRYSMKFKLFYYIRPSTLTEPIVLEESLDWTLDISIARQLSLFSCSDN